MTTTPDITLWDLPDIAAACAEFWDIHFLGDYEDDEDWFEDGDCTPTDEGGYWYDPNDPTA